VKLVDLRFQDTANAFGNLLTVPTAAGVGDLGEITTIKLPLPAIFETRSFSKTIPTGTRLFKAVTMLDFVGSNDPQAWIHLGSTVASPPTLPLTTYSVSFVWSPQGANRDIFPSFPTGSVCDFMSGGISGTRSWGIKYQNGTLGFWGGAQIGTAGAYTGGPFKFEIQVNGGISPKVTVRLYRVSDNQRLASGTISPGSVACDTIRFGDTGNDGLTTEYYWTDWQVWNSYNGDGEWPTTSPASTTYAGSSIRDAYTVPSTYRSNADIPAANYTSWEGVDHLRYGSTTDAHRLNLFIPNGVPSNPAGFPLVIWTHGGFFVQGDKIEMPVNWRNELLAAGYAVAAIRYVRSTLKVPAEGVYEPWGTSDTVSENISGYGRYPSWVCDAKLATVRLKARYAQNGTEPKLNPQSYGFDPARIFIGGHSAGGMIGMMAGTTKGLTNDGSGRNMTLAGNPTYAVDENGNTYSGADPTYLGCFGYAAPINLATAMAFDKTDELSTNPSGVLTINARTRLGNPTFRGFVASAGHAFLGNLQTVSDPVLTNTDIPNLISRNVAANGAAAIAPIYYVRGTADYLIHWEHEPLLAAQMATSGITAKYTTGTNPANHDFANRIYNYSELLGWLGGLATAGFDGGSTYSGPNLPSIPHLPSLPNRP
jgi:acetyl esterase/lipase